MMLALIRHAPTGWNARRRIQGRAEVPLSGAGRAMAGRWHLPEGLDEWRWLASPLLRARETAAILGAPAVGIEPRLVEMDWGAWVGGTLEDLRRSGGAAMAANEARGLDFRPEGGESPREVRHRLASLLDELAADGRDTVAVTHRGVIRAAVGLATGWDFLGRPPLKPERDAILMLEVGPGGAVSPGNPALVPMGGVR